MSETGTTQSELARLSGVHQPSVSQFLSAKVDFSDEQLDRLLSCMGYRLEVVRRAVKPELTRAERRSWKLHRQLSTQLNRSTLALTGLDRDSIEMHEVTPMSGLLSVQEGTRVLEKMN
jgi:transcriptional regulator with XRE-family HTH domain